MSISELLTQYGFSLESMLVSIFLGLMVALGILIYNKCVPGRIVRFLMHNSIHTDSDAVTLEQAGFSRNFLIRYALRDGSILRKIVACLPDEENATDQKGRTNLLAARFYLPEEMCARAEIAYNNNGTSVFTVLLTVLIFLAMMLLVAFLAPELVTMFENLIDMIKSQ